MVHNGRSASQARGEVWVFEFMRFGYSLGVDALGCGPLYNLSGRIVKSDSNWRTEGVRVIKSDRLDSNTPQTPGMLRAAAVNFARVGSQKLWAGTVIIQPNAKTGAHHHGALESVIYVVRGAARMRWGDRLEFTAKADAGDFIFVPPYVPHQEINALSDAPLECVLVRSDNESVVVNLNIDAAERFEEVYWIDPIHPAPR
jgi:uncharacterized RmlC-like cupin family protein